MRFFRPYYEGEGGGAGGGAPLTIDKWREALPADIQGEASLANIQDVAGLAKSYVHAQRMIGRDKIAIPGTDAKPEDWAAVMARLGRPETPDKYDLALSGLPEGFQPDIDDKSWREWAHKHHLLPWQAKALYQELASSRASKWQEGTTAANTARTEADTALKAEWGAAYGQNVTLAEKAFRQFAPKELVEGIEKAGGVSKMHPLFLKAFAAAGKLIAEDGLKGDGSGSQFAMTPAQAKAAVAKFDTDNWKAMSDPMNPQIESLRAERARLYKMAYPGEAA